jgi:prepilin-type N-terminal cleavage/methylation domain-containing protein
MAIGKVTKIDRKHRNLSGFTLIELLIVVAIIAILAAVALPNFFRARDRVKVTTCVDQLSNLRTAAEDYMVEHGNLANLVQWQDLCAHMYAGITDPATCSTQLEDRINQVCEDGTFAWNQPSDYFFEITANANNEGKCFICLTSDTTIPADDEIPACPETACP